MRRITVDRDRAWLEDLFDRHSRHLRAFAVRRVGADAADDVAPYGADARRRLLDAAISEADDAAAADGGDATTPTATSPRRGSRHRRVRVLLAACAALVVASLGYQSVTASVGAAEAAEVLGQAAIHASDPPAKPGQYWEITRIGTNLADGGDGESDRRYLVRTTHIAYVSVDGRRPTWLVAKPAVTVRQVFGPPQERGGHGRGEAWTSNLSPEQKPGWWGEPSPSWFASLPREAGKLRARLYADTEGHGNNPDDEAFIYIADVLRSGVVPADLRAALYNVLKTIPGTTVTDRQVRLEDGRSGVAIGRNDIFGSHDELVIDPKTGDVIGERSFMRLVPFVGEELALSTGVQRRLVDAIPADIQRTAERQTCKVVNGEVECD